MEEVRIAIVGDHDPARETHRATSDAIGHAADAHGVDAPATWVATPDLATDAELVLAGFAGVWIAPGSPYRSMVGALEAIRVARTAGIPLIGTCGGFQHVVLEYARNVLGFADAQHAEYEPSASRLFVTELACSLAGRTMAVTLRPGTVAAASYGANVVSERYYCNFGLEQQYVPALEAAGLVVSGTDHDGEVRVVELPGHPFFVGTLFVPQVDSAASRPHPLVLTFVEVAKAHAASRSLGFGQRPPETSRKAPLT